MSSHKIDEPLVIGKYTGVLMYQVIGTDFNYTNWMLEKNYWSKTKVINGLKMFGIENLTMTFGKFKGRRVLELTESKPEYFDWLIEQGSIMAGILNDLCDNTLETQASLV